MLGSHGRSFIDRLIRGSVSDRVVRTAACPVLVIPASDNTTDTAQHHSSTISAMNPERAKQLLATERERIEQAIAEFGQEGPQGSPNSASPATRLRGPLRKRVRRGACRGSRPQLAALERAEQRLAAGTFGLSAESGEPIPDERLEALPTAELTVEEQTIPGARRSAALWL